MAFGEALGKTNTYNCVPYDVLKQAFLARGVPPWEVEGLIQVYKTVNSGSQDFTEADTSHFHQITGEQPTSLRAWVSQVKHAFQWSGGHIGSFFCNEFATILVLCHFEKDFATLAYGSSSHEPWKLHHSMLYIIIVIAYLPYMAAIAQEDFSMAPTTTRVLHVPSYSILYHLSVIGCAPN